MGLTSSLPRVAFVIDLDSINSSAADVALLRHLVQLFDGHRVPATWVVDGKAQVDLIQAQKPPVAEYELAFAVRGPWCNSELPLARFRSEIASRCTSVQSSAAATSLVVGDPQALRSRAAVLAECGVQGVLSDSEQASHAIRPRQFPCGLWQLESTARLPQPGGLKRWFGPRRLSVKQLATLGASAETTLVAIAFAKLGNVGARGLQILEKLLRDVSWAASRDQLIVSTTREILAGLISRHDIKPQRSILRVAA